jgi:hypothetical protein
MEFMVCETNVWLKGLVNNTMRRTIRTLLIQSKTIQRLQFYNTIIMITFINEEEKLKHPYYKLDGIER